MDEPEEKTRDLEDLIPSHTIELSPAAWVQLMELLTHPPEPPALARREAQEYLAEYGLRIRLATEEKSS